MSVVYAAGGEQVYISNRDTVQVIDITTNNTVETIPGYDRPAKLAIQPDGSIVAVVDPGPTAGVTGTVSLIDTSTNIITTNIDIGGYPGEAAFHPNGELLYIASANGGEGIKVLNIATETFTTTAVTESSAPGTYGEGLSDIAVAPDGGFLYVSNRVDDQVSVIDASTQIETAVVAVGATPSALVVMPDGAKVVTLNDGDDTLTVIDTATNLVVDTIDVGALGVTVGDDLAFNPAGQIAYLAPGTNSVAVLDFGTKTLVVEVPVGNGGHSIVAPPCPSVPEAPTGVAGVAGNGTVAVTWGASPDDWGSSITGYTVTASPGGATCTTGGALACTVSGLTNGTAYSFTSVATNDIGDGAVSTPSNAVTPTDPNTPSYTG